MRSSMCAEGAINKRREVWRERTERAALSDGIPPVPHPWVQPVVICERVSLHEELRITAGSEKVEGG